MHDMKKSDQLEKDKDLVRCECIGDRNYFQQIQCESMFQLKSAYVPIESIIKK
ncbi:MULTISPECIES: hypothetical protein [Clostridium]|uniref:Uncharacterized protein n=1 Tax=Clostridium scatologenes TaxID=1548 RepID=A0A0E3GQF7_CLOSL|nr:MULTISPECIES: hypothetical protein [Clostridium]AKA68491.1 hypothetical protein CSCA_1366 [Clostridium scatologenes]